MNKLLLSAITLLSAQLAAQTWTQIPTPVDDQVFEFRIESSADDARLVLLPTFITWDSLYTKTGTGSWVGARAGQYPDGFYANNGTLFVVEDIDPNSAFSPVVHQSSDNGLTFTVVPDATGRCFNKDQDGNLFFSTASGFKYSTDDGMSFSTVVTPALVTSAAMDSNGDLYFGSDSLYLYRSTDGGSTWTDISKGVTPGTWVHKLQVQNGTLYFDNSNGSYLFGALSDASWSGVQPGTISTSWVGGMRVHPDSYFIESPYGLYTSQTWMPSNWNQVIAGAVGGMPTAFGYFIGGYSLSTNHVYARVDSGFVRTTIASTVSIEEFASEANAPAVYPNPVNDLLWIQGSANGIVRIHSVDGRLMLEGARTDEPLYVGHLPAGVYMLIVQSRSGTHTYRIVKR